MVATIRMAVFLKDKRSLSKIKKIKSASYNATAYSWLPNGVEN
jgi:hypothetical protein